MRQHLTAVNAAAEIGGARLEGAAVGSQTLEFHPAGLRAGDYRFAIGTAGSTTLVFQTILLPLLAAGGPSTLTLEGGTHNPFAPTFDFLARVYLPLLRRMGAQVEATLEVPGFAPGGGGRFTARITPSKLTPLRLLERGEVRAKSGEALFSALPFTIAQRELAVLQQRLEWGADSFRPRQVEAPSPGNVVSVEVESEHVTERFSHFGEKGVTAERVAARVAGEARAYLESGVPVGQHLADQLLLPLALAGGGAFVTQALTEHSKTQIALLRQLLGTEVRVSEEVAGRVRVEVGSLNPRARTPCHRHTHEARLVASDEAQIPAPDGLRAQTVVGTLDDVKAWITTEPMG
jgi:RNA 3'-terminal phosphate cyclase (ATP)